MRRAIAFLVVMALALPVAGWAQTTTTPAIDASKLGVSLDRIRRELAPESTETFRADGLKLNVRVDVFGQAPPIDFVPEDFSLSFGPVPHSAPTHREHLDFVTPQQFRSPTVPVYGLAVWAAQKLADRSKKARCEEELRNYRALVMQGVAVAAPRCTQ
jgi:hypothetical protein